MTEGVAEVLTYAVGVAISTPGAEPERLTSMPGIDAFSPGKALTLGLSLEEN